jgi:hypothetical protein
VAARSTAWVCGRSLAGTVGSNPTGGMDVSLLYMLCVVRKRCLCRVDHSSRGVQPSVCVCLWVWYWSFGNEEAFIRNRAERPQKKASHYKVRHVSVSMFRINILPQPSGWIKLFQNNDDVVERRKCVVYKLYFILFRPVIAGLFQADRQTDWQTGRQTGRQTDKQVDRQTNRQTDWMKII